MFFSSSLTFGVLTSPPCYFLFLGFLRPLRFIVLSFRPWIVSLFHNAVLVKLDLQCSLSEYAHYTQQPIFFYGQVWYKMHLQDTRQSVTSVLKYCFYCFKVHRTVHVHLRGSHRSHKQMQPWHCILICNGQHQLDLLACGACRISNASQKDNVKLSIFAWCQ